MPPRSHVTARLAVAATSVLLVAALAPAGARAQARGAAASGRSARTQASAARADARRGRDEPERLTVRGTPGAWFYRPAGGRGRQRVLVYLHARNADPAEHCRRWSQFARAHGWLLCPIGPVDRGEGRREWRNNRDYAHRATIAALDALAARFPRRVRRHDNVLLGFSEGAYVGMNVALMAPRTFPRWFIVAADDRYIDGEGERIRRAAATVRRVYLLTGAGDNVLARTRRAYERLERAFGRRRIRMRVLEGMGHELPTEQVAMTRNILYWVTR